MRAPLAHALRISLLLAGGVLCLRAGQDEEPQWRVVHEPMHHLGDDETPDWKEAPAQPEKAPLELRFRSAANAGEWVLELSARDVDNDWALELNGSPLARLKRGNDVLRVSRYPLPAGALQDGENVLVVRPVDQPADDMTVGRVRL